MLFAFLLLRWDECCGSRSSPLSQPACAVCEEGLGDFLKVARRLPRCLLVSLAPWRSTPGGFPATHRQRLRGSDFIRERNRSKALLSGNDIHAAATASTRRLPLAHLASCSKGALDQASWGLSNHARSAPSTGARGLCERCFPQSILMHEGACGPRVRLCRHRG